MASSIVEKYERILAADPRSRIFVELAKALVDRGEHARAVEVCQRGLEHHPGSILARVTWGRALLLAGDVKGAMDQFEIAIALEPASPYAFNHVGEALLAKGLHREALPVLARAAELQPGDPRVRALLEDAKQHAKEHAAGAEDPDRKAVEDDDWEARTERYRLAAAGKASLASTSALSAHPERSAAAGGAESKGTPGETPADGATPSANGATLPPPLPPAAPTLAPPAPKSVLHMIPGESTREVIGPSLASRLNIPAAHGAWPPPAAPTDHAAVERAAAQYERELRDKLLAAPEPPPSFLHRHRRRVLAGAIVLALGAAGAVYLVVSARNTAILAASAAVRARAGLARDTLASLTEAHRLLAIARGRTTDPEVASLAAQVAAVLAVEHDDDQARREALALVESGTAGDGAIAATWLIASTPEKRAAAEAAVLATPPSSAPLLQALAGRILVAHGEREGGRGRLELAARANPPLLRALSDLGDLALAGGDPEGAIAYYGAAPPPKDVRIRFEIARARVVAALGEPGPAAARLARAAEVSGESARIAATVAEIQLQARAWDKAEAAAARAVAREPREPDHRVLLARARIGRGRFVEALAATDGADGRAIHVQRAIARYRLGQWTGARAELEKTGHDGKLPAEAAVWYALVDVASGKADRALHLLEKLTEAKAPPPLAHVALGRALETLGRLPAAEAAYRAAAEREPLAPEGYAALGRVLLDEGRARDAIAPLERAVKLDASELAARRTLGEARLAAGQPSAARADLDVVLLAAPKDAAALRLLSSAWLAEGQANEARRAADRALAVAPRDPAVLLAAARAALGTGDGVAARKLAGRAVKAGASGPERDEAKRLAAGQLPRKPQTSTAPEPRGPGASSLR